MTHSVPINLFFTRQAQQPPCPVTWMVILSAFPTLTLSENMSPKCIAPSDSTCSKLDCTYWQQKSTHGRALTALPKRGVGAVLSVSVFNHKRVLCHVYSDSCPVTKNNIQWNHRWLQSRVLTAQNT